MSGLSRRVGQSFAGSGEIKRREVSGFSRRVGQSFAGPGEIKRREVMLDRQENPEEIKSREVVLSSERWTSFALVVPKQQSDIVFVTLLRTAVETTINGVHKLLRTGEVPTALT